MADVGKTSGLAEDSCLGHDQSVMDEFEAAKVAVFKACLIHVHIYCRGGGMSFLGLFKHHLFNGVFSLSRCCQLSFSFV